MLITQFKVILSKVQEGIQGTFSNLATLYSELAFIITEFDKKKFNCIHLRTIFTVFLNYLQRCNALKLSLIKCGLIGNAACVTIAFIKNGTRLVRLLLKYELCAVKLKSDAFHFAFY